MLETIERIAERDHARLSVQPNAGRPRDVEGRNIYLSSPEYMASYARRFVAAGVRLVGGCCGTTPEHMRQIGRGARLGAGGGARDRGRAVDARPVPPPRRRSRCASEKSRFAQHAVARPVRARRRARSAARATQREEFVERAASCGATASIVVNVPDGPRGRADGAAAAAVLARATGRRRDRAAVPLSRPAAGRHAGRAARRARAGLRNMLLVTGEPRGAATTPTRPLVFEVDSIGLANAVTRLNRRPRSRRPADRRADRVSHRRRVRIRRRADSTRRCGAIATRPRRAPNSP